MSGTEKARDAAGLLASCLRGVEDDDVARGWRSYVVALEIEIGGVR